METVENALARTRRALSEARHGPDRLIHPLRRKAVRTTLESLSLPVGLLFVCHGNICRSPYAEQAFSDRLIASVRERVTLGSAGFVGPGRPSPPEALQVARARGVDLSRHRSRLLTDRLVRSYDIVVVMDARQRRAVIRGFGATPAHTVLLGDLDPRGVRRRTIADPFRRPAEVFERVYSRIDRCLDLLLRSLVADARSTLAGRVRDRRIPAPRPNARPG